MDDDPVTPDPQHDSAGGGCGGKLVAVFALILLATVISIWSFTYYKQLQALESLHQNLEDHEKGLAIALDADEELKGKIADLFDRGHATIDARGPSTEQVLLTSIIPLPVELSHIDFYIKVLEVEKELKKHGQVPAGQRLQGLRALRHIRHKIVDAENLQDLLGQFQHHIFHLQGLLGHGGLHAGALGSIVQTLDDLLKGQPKHGPETPDDILRDIDILLARLANP